MRSVLLLSLFCWTLAAAADPAYQRLYVFGDSYSDTGAGYVDGNGPTAVAYLAERLGISLLNASDATSTAKSSLNFAVSGARTGRGTGRKIVQEMLGLGMENQVEDFIKRNKEGRIQFDERHTLFFVAGGLNDKGRESAETVSNLEGEIRALYATGARHFELAILPTEIPAFRDVAIRLNPEIAKIPERLKRELDGLDIRLSQWGKYFDEVMLHPADYGIENTTDACAGRAIFNEDSTPCKSPAAYYYYHTGHPSTAVHKAVGEKLFQELGR